MSKFSIGTLAVLAALSAARCTTTKAGPPPPVPPLIKTFAADKTMVSAGQAVKLTFTTADAKDLSLISQDGAEVPVTGTVESGEAIVKPLKTSFYVLRATGAGGKDSAFVQVAVNEGLTQVFLIAVPAEISSGEQVELVWSALGGTNISVKDSTGTTLSTEESGTKSAAPEKTTTWTLRANGPAGMKSATAQVTVRPVIQEFSAAPPAARQGQKIRLAWKTAGADSVVLREATFGELRSTTTDVATGSHEFLVPTDFAGAADAGLVPDNFPLQFTLTARSTTPMQAVTARLASVVRDGPIITSFDAPAAVSENKPFTLSWKVTGLRSELLVDGAPVYSTIPPAVASSSLAMAGLKADATVTLVAYDYLGLKVSSSKLIKAVKLPKAVTFTLPTTVGSANTSASAAWTTTNASLVVVRVKDGPAVFTTGTAAQVLSGTGSLYPARDTTYVLEAYNSAGDFDSREASIAVAAPVTAGATPSPTSPNQPVVISWNITAQSPAEVIGLPSEPPQVIAGSTGFVDLEPLTAATKLGFVDRADGTAVLTTGQGYGFPFIASSFSTFTVGVNGFVALGATAGGTLVSNVDLKATTGLPTVPLIAPFWDNLDLGTAGDVFWALDGAAFPRRLIVQWNKVNIGSDPSSNLTFQVQLFETGEVRFLYKTLADANSLAQGQGATVGIYAGAIFAGQHSYNAATLAEGQELAWFNQGAQTGMVTVTAGTANFTPSFFYKTASGGWVHVSMPVRVFAAGSVRVNEVMPSPNPGAAMGQYVELHNPQTTALDLSGLQLISTTTPLPGFTLPAGTTIAAKGYLVLGQSADPAQNGGAGVTTAYGAEVPFGAGADGVVLQIPGTTPFEISRLTWTTSVASEAVQLEPAIGTVSCTRMRKFGPLMSLGTPGMANESCFPYTVEKIPVAFEDVSAGAALLPTTTWDDERATVTLPMPFKYFGADKTSATVSGNGWLSFKPVTVSGFTNRTTVSATTEPVGAICPFWDDLEDNDTLAGMLSNVYQARIGTHHVIQWARVSTRTVGVDDLNFEVKLFDSGVFELHYGAMISGDSTKRADGNSATVWVENPSGTAALPISLNQPLIQPNSAWRFTPSP